MHYIIANKTTPVTLAKQSQSIAGVQQQFTFFPHNTRGILWNSRQKNAIYMYTYKKSKSTNYFTLIHVQIKIKSDER